jgi:DNA polymerase-3 subunit delta'
MALRDIIGQDRAIRILRKTLERRKIPSSYLFAGESGIGKKMTAINLAKALNCFAAQGHDNQITAYDCCDACSSCRKIDANMHPDFRLISPENGLIKIEEIREIDKILSLKAFEGRYKTVIVDDAEAMNQSAANAFLKTLEEPPEQSLIILVSSNPDRLPDTMRSRCSRINFMPLSLKDCEEVIQKGTGRLSGRKHKKTGETPRTTIYEPHLEAVLRLSMGKPGNILSGDLMEQRTRFLALLEGMLTMAKDSWGSREEMEKWFDLMLILLRDMAVLKITQDEKHLVNSDMKEYIAQLSSAMDIKGIIEQYQRLNTLKKRIHFNLNKSLTWNYASSLLRKDMGGPYA